MYKILLCEDEANIVAFLQPELEFEGFDVDAAADGGAALRLFGAGEYDLVLLDVMLPKKNGLEVLREIRKSSAVPVIILTARKEVYDKVAFLNAGADDYITKPFDTLELLARIKRNLARAQERINPPQEVLRVCKDSHRAWAAGTEMKLTKTEFEILSYLYDNADKVMTRDEIIAAVFGDFYGESNIVDANIKNIRAKLAPLTPREIIHTIRGKGYVVRL